MSRQRAIQADGTAHANGLRRENAWFGQGSEGSEWLEQVVLGEEWFMVELLRKEEPSS